MTRNRTYTLQSPAYQLMLNGYDKMIKAEGYRQKGTTYQNNIKEFLYFWENKGKLVIKKITALDLIEYYEYISTRPSHRSEGVLSSSTISQHLFAIGLLYEYLAETGQIDKKFVLPKHNRGDGKQRQILSQDEITSLYEVCETKRDRAILAIGYGCGARREEIVNLNIADVQLHKQVMYVRKGKGDKRREIPLSSGIVKDLKDYLHNERHMYFTGGNDTKTDAFLINSKGTRMLGNHINDRLKELIEKVGNPELTSKAATLHNLRHSIGTHLIDNGASIEFVRDYLGHVEINTAHIYSRKRRMKQRLNSSSL